ncbi:hypothetical protein K1719_029190 [Acacia pycnantha]|nr:hypothetical protein K1719_029190 [Acacia pycnantha]
MSPVGRPPRLGAGPGGLWHLPLQNPRSALPVRLLSASSEVVFLLPCQHKVVVDLLAPYRRSEERLGCLVVPRQEDHKMLVIDFDTPQGPQPMEGRSTFS